MGDWWETGGRWVGDGWETGGGPPLGFPAHWPCAHRAAYPAPICPHGLCTALGLLLHQLWVVGRATGQATSEADPVPILQMGLQRNRLP